MVACCQRLLYQGARHHLIQSLLKLCTKWGEGASRVMNKQKSILKIVFAMPKVPGLDHSSKSLQTQTRSLHKMRLQAQQDFIGIGYQIQVNQSTDPDDPLQIVTSHTETSAHSFGIEIAIVDPLFTCFCCHKFGS